MDINNGFIAQWFRPTTTTVTLPISFKSTNYASAWMEKASSWEEENLSRRQLQMKSKAKTGWTRYNAYSTVVFMAIGY